MNLAKKKILAAKTLCVGKERIIFNVERLADIKEAITKQDIRDLHRDKAISIKEINGRATVERRKNRRRKGSVKHTRKRDKRSYVILTRKLRSNAAELYRKGTINKEMFLKIRKEIKTRAFKSKLHFKEVVTNRLAK